MASELIERILFEVDKYKEIDSFELVTILKEDHQKIIGAIKSIEAYNADMICSKSISKKNVVLTQEGIDVIKNGSHEALMFYAVPDDGIPQSKLMLSTPNSKIGFSKAMSLGWIYIDKSTNIPIIRKKVDSITDTIRDNLKNIQEHENTSLNVNVINDFKKRKLLNETITKGFMVSKDKAFALNIQKMETDLSVDMLINEQWKSLKYKTYNFDALGVSPEKGNLHPLLKVRSEFRQIFLEMGFSEMPTNNYVESSFWNFDALYQPQQHPARDAHDTFFINYPATSNKFPFEYLERVKKVHTFGDYGSKGYGYDWKIEEAQKNLLRTHTTAVSARMLYKLANQPGGFKPAKYFSIDKVFRNETLDATHLAEFQQVEGVIADVGLNLGNLIGTLYEFFKKLGIEKLQFKPAYNPYTEPSMEIFCFHPGLNKWIEVGNSGIFRPEMLLPMGIPENVNVIAWGLSLERPTMIKYGFNNIRELVGPKVDLKMVRNAPICRLDR